MFVQFFTRYVLNNSFAWTEEIAVYCLVAVVLCRLGHVRAAVAAYPCRFLYRYLPPRLGRLGATFVDLMRIGIFSYLALLVWRYSEVISDEAMTTINFPKMPVFMIVFAAFVLMALRSVQVMIASLRQGYSVLERPGAFDGSVASDGKG